MSYFTKVTVTTNGANSNAILHNFACYVTLKYSVLIFSQYLLEGLPILYDTLWVIHRTPFLKFGTVFLDRLYGQEVSV